MNTYEQEIELVNLKMDKLEGKVQDESIDITFNRRKQIDKWTYECLEKYMFFLMKLNNPIVKNMDNIIQTFRKHMNGCFNITNFHSYIKKNENSLKDLIAPYPDLETAYSDFIEQVKKEPSNTEIMYKKIYEPYDLQKIIKKRLNKLDTSARIQKDFLDLFCNECYYDKVDSFFTNMYDYCDNSKQYRIPKYYYEDFVDTFLETIDDEEDYDNEDEKKTKEIKKTLITNNKLTFLEILFTFLLYPTEYLLNYLYNEITYPILEQCEILSQWEIEAYFGEHKNTDRTIKKDLYLNKYGVGKVIKSKRAADHGYRYSEKTITFFDEKNHSHFFKDTNDFLNIYNKFFLGKIIRKKLEDIIKEAISNKELTDLEKTTEALLDYYHMQNTFHSIVALFKFQRIDKSYITNKIESNLSSIERTLKKKYPKNSKYSDIPGVFMDLLHEQQYFYKITINEIIGKTVIRTNEQEEYLCIFGNSINNDEKEKILSSKFNPDNINKSLENYETILYNIVARVKDPHITEKQKEDYFKQLTVFYPDVYSSLIY